MHSFEINKHGKIVFPSNCFPDLDFSTFESLEQLDAVVRRDFDSKAPTGTDILERIKTGAYQSKFELMRDMALNLFWANRFKMTMYDVRPTRWADVPRSRDDVFVPILTPWEDRETKVTAVLSAYPGLPAQWDAEVEDSIFEILFDVFGHRRNHATKLSAVIPTVADLLSDPGNQTLRLNRYDPDFRRYSYTEIIDCNEDVAELEALRRWSMVLHNQYPWDRSEAALVPVGELRDDDYVVVFHPRDPEVQLFPVPRRLGARPEESPLGVPRGSRARFARTPPSTCATTSRYNRASRPSPPCTAIWCAPTRTSSATAPTTGRPCLRTRSLAKTGIEQRRYTSDSLEDLSLRAARSALAHAQVGPEEIGAVFVCTCTSSRLIPSVATWLSGRWASSRRTARSTSSPRAPASATGWPRPPRVLQLVQRPVLVVCAEKFSDKIGNVRPSRMIFGDGAAAIVLGVAPEGSPPDIEYMQTYASGPISQVNSILWPNPAFANNITVFGPEVKALAGRYLRQMLDDIRALPDPDGVAESLLASIELIVPHQANKTMVIDLATGAGLSPDQLYFNIERVGNASSASIPLAIHDAVRDGVITDADPGFRPGFRCRRGRRLCDSADRSCRHRARRPGGANSRVGRRC